MYACIAETKTGARCRNWSVGEDGFCANCRKKEEAVISRVPDAVLYKFNINERYRDWLVSLGVPVKERDVEKEDQNHAAHAEKFGREAFRFRKEVADSGVPVFGADGLEAVSVYELFRELVVAYEIVDIHIRPRRDRNKWMNVLVIAFSHGNQSQNVGAVDAILDFLASSRWGHCHVWANPPQADGRVVHTVNTSHREQDQKPECVLRFVNGLWAVEPVAD